MHEVPELRGASTLREICFELAGELHRRSSILFPDMLCGGCKAKDTVSPETIDPFAAFFSRSIRGSTPRFHLANNAACRKNSSVLPKFTTACDSAVKEVPR